MPVCTGLLILSASRGFVERIQENGKGSFLVKVQGSGKIQPLAL